jgi:hypothetical protein
MAFLQSDLPPSTAPASPARARAIPAPPRRRYSRLIGRLLFASTTVALLAILGVAAARATESLAVGIIAADLVFLVTVAGWSTVASRARR